MIETNDTNVMNFDRRIYFKTNKMHYFLAVYFDICQHQRRRFMYEQRILLSAMTAKEDRIFDFVYLNTIRQLLKFRKNKQKIVTA